MSDTKMSDEMATGIDDVVDVTAETVEPSGASHESEDTQAEPDDEGEPEDDSKGGREAARYRRRLRDTEAERDALTERVESLQRSVVEGIVTEGGMGGRMHTAEPFWAGGVDLADLLDEGGNVDRDAVLAAVDEIAARFGITRRPKPNTVLGEGHNPTLKGRDSMVNVVRGRR